MQAPQLKPQGVAVTATVGSAFGGAVAGGLLGWALCGGELGFVIGAASAMITFAAGYGTWAAYALAQAHRSLFKLLWSAFRRRHEQKTLDREQWRAEFAQVFDKVTRASFLFWLNALWVGVLGAIAMALCARSVVAAFTLLVAVFAYGLALARLARRGYLALPEE